MTTPGSSEPQRVLMTRPSRGENPIVVATLLPLSLRRDWRRCQGDDDGPAAGFWSVTGQELRCDVSIGDSAEPKGYDA